MATRGVFALITVKNVHGNFVLLSERADGKGWKLPGGAVEEGESDFDALVREVREETCLEVEVLEQVGSPLVFKDDTAVAYACTIVGGRLEPTDEAIRHHYCTADDLRAGRIRVGMSEGLGQWIPLKLVGPEGRLGRMGRMVWDALSILEDPQMVPNKVPNEWLIEGVFVTEDGCFLWEETPEVQKKWPRLDPYSPSGKVEPPQ